MIRAWAAKGRKQKLEPFNYEPGELGPEEVEIAVEHCGICHSDLSVINDDWGISTYPLIPGHEAVGRVVALGAAAKGLRLGQKVGVGWSAGSCLHCRQCLAGDQHLCAENVATILGHNGAFADRLRAQWPWAIPLPENLDMREAGPLLCGGVTVFSPLKIFDVKPTHRVGVVGIGGLGHLALKFARAWGCEVVAFTSNLAKAEEAKSFGAHEVLGSRSAEELARASDSLDLLLVTANVPLDWSALIATLRPKGRLHLVGAVLEPIAINAMHLIDAQHSLSGSPTGSPVTIAEMLEFAARHGILPQTEHFPLDEVNEALARLAAGKARYRIVLDM
ncbi:MAG TPA: NAD(P)-dependent alcohol dehydrogenase [Methylocystis sp.]|nr:NAD(P)-dependent alcohol dehydrogenase [Methylocystis sp.]